MPDIISNAIMPLILFNSDKYCKISRVSQTCDCRKLLNMGFPEIRRPGITHLDPQYIEIEELFWSNKPPTKQTYKSVSNLGLDLVQPPNIDLESTRKIWGSKYSQRLIPAAHISHLSIFAIPQFIDALDQTSSQFGSTSPKHSRFSELLFEQDISSFWTSHASVLPIEHTKTDPEDLRFSIGAFHSSSRSQKHFQSQYRPKQEYLGVPESSLAMSVYEVVHIGEELALRKGIDVHINERDLQYEYFRRILFDGGIWMPDTRQEMESIAVKLDRLAELNSSTLELMERTIRRAILPIPGISFNTVVSVLRPGAAGIFSSICETYGYFGK